MRRSTVLLLTAIAAVAAAGWGWHVHRRPQPPAVRFEPAGHAVLAAAGIQESASPRLAFTTSDALDVLATAAVHGQDRLVFAASRDGGDSFAAPVPVSPEGAAIMTRGEMGPVLRAHGGDVYALWQQGVGAAPSQIVLAHSANSGAGFPPPVPVVHKPPAAAGSFSGFANFAVAPAGDLYAVWLDGRDPKRAAGTFDVELARSTDKGATWSEGVRVAAQSCPCCRPAVAIDERGNVYVAFRKVYPGDQRDLAIAVSHDGGQHFGAPARVAGERWTLHACPESGPALVAWNGHLAAAWFSGAGVPGVRVAISGDGARTFQVSAVSAAIKDQNHPSLSLSEDGVLWLSLQGRAVTQENAWPPLQAFVVRVDASGQLSGPVAVPGAPITGYPAVAAAPGGRVFVASAVEAMDRGQVRLARGRF